MKQQLMAASAMAFLTTVIAVSPAQGQAFLFNGTVTGQSGISDPNSLCVAPSSRSSVISGSGTSNISAFTSSQTECSSLAFPRSIVGGVFTYKFEAGDTIFGTYTGTATIDGNDNASFAITGGTGRFVGASGTIDSQASRGSAPTLSGSLAATTTTASGNFATAFGVPSAATGDFSTAIGAFSFAPGARSTAIGSFAETVGAGSVAIGSNTSAFSLQTVAIGEDARALREQDIAIGNGAFAAGGSAIALGRGASVNGSSGIAIGGGAVTGPAGSLAIGSRAAAFGLSGVSVGGSSLAGFLSVALGTGANAATDRTVAVGTGASATASNAVALGQNSVADQANTVSVGTVGGERRIVNVAAGTATTDAVNFGQLSAANAGISATNAGLAALSTMVDNLSFDIRSTGRDARAGTAAALAAAGLPQAQGAGRTMIAGGVGTYRGRTALAFGASHRLQNGSGTFKLGVTYDTSEHSGANAGFGFEF